MKNLVSVLCGTACALGLFVQAASAADLPYKAPPLSAPAPFTAAPFSWTGLYVGVQGGVAWGRSHHTSSGGGIPQTPDFDVNGGLFGATLGYNLQSGAIVYGVEGDLSWSNLKGSITSASTAGCAATCNTELDWFGTARGRLGVSWGKLLPFVTGGVAFGRVEAGDNFLPVSDKNTKTGWTLGGGVEAALMPNWSAKLEYLYVDFGSNAVNYGTLPTWSPTDASLKMNVIRAGLNYKFN